MRVSVISNNLPVSDFHGGCSYLASVEAGLLAQGVGVHHVWLTQGSKRRPYRIPFALPRGIRLHVLDSWTRGRWILPLLCPDHAWSSAVARHIARVRPSIVLIDRAPLAEHWERREDCPSWVLTHDLLHRRSKIPSCDEGSETFRVDWETESAWLRRADGVIAIQESEAEFFRQHLSGMTVITVPHPTVAERLPDEQILPCHLLFVGGRSAPNVEGLRWFIREVFPTVLAERPESRLMVAGSVGASIDAHRSIDLKGHVQDLRQAYRQAHVCIAPLLSGTGLKIKVVEAMGFGRPVVCAPAAVEGVWGLVNAVAAVADQPDEFASMILKLFADHSLLDRCISRQAQWVEEHLKPEIALQPILNQLPVKE